ncbi:MAG: CRISPR-associated protein Csx11 [Candidatus Bipolaricaulia bacterium]
MSGELEKLKEYRDQILLTEVGVWLHLLGKFSSQFFKDQVAGKGKNYKEFYKNIDTSLKELYDNSWPEKHWHIPSLKGVQWSQSLAQFSKQHDNQQFAEGKSPVTIAVDAHGRGSGTDKSVQAKDIYLQQALPIYLATAFGHESVIDSDKLDGQRDELYELVRENLEQIKSKLESEEEINWRKTISKLIDRLCKDFASTVGDTRRPINDVSLWDQTSSTVAFFKPSLAKNILLGDWKNPLETKYKWRFLRIAVDGLSYWSAANRIGDLRARQDLVTQALDNIKGLLEITYPIGAEVYRDETGSLFLLPDEPENLLDLTTDGLSLEQHIQAKVIEATQGEITAKIDLDDCATRNVFRAGYWLSQPLPPVSADSAKLKEWWSQEHEEEHQLLCSICALRPQGYGGSNANETAMALERDMCCVCMNRMAGQAERWREAGLDRTIWIDEASDINGRVALIVGEFDLEDWLNGIYTSSMTIPDPGNLDGNETGNDFSQLLTELRQGLKNDDSLVDSDTFPIINTLLDPKVKGDLGSFKRLYEFLVEEEDLSEAGRELENSEKLALALVRKPPSFARIRRLWTTTQRFWEEVRDESISASVGRCSRLEFSANYSPVKDQFLQQHQAYELVMNGHRLPVFCKDRNSLRFLTIERLDYALKQLNWNDIQEMIAQLKRPDNSFELETPSEYGGKRREIGSLSHIQVTGQTEYQPHIPILAEPRTFMALVPADKALDIAQAIKTKYEREMGKVHNRLPLHLGAVFFPRKQPLRAVLEAGRRMLTIVQSDEMCVWKLSENAQVQDGNCILHFDNGVEWEISVQMGDEKTEDKWYPYFFIKEGGENAPEPKNRGLAFEGIRPIRHDKTESCWLVHVKKLCQGDQVYITSSLFDFEWLDTNARRFDVSYAEGKRRAPDKRNRPYLLDDLERFACLWKLIYKNLTTSQVKHLDGLIEAKRQEWGEGTGQQKYSETFEQFVCDALKTAGWKKNPKDWDSKEWEMLYRATLTGELHDVLELYMEILKCKPKRDRQEEKEKS